jgi:hypothetical protein
MPDLPHLLAVHRRRLAAEPHAGARRAVHRDQLAALRRARRRRGGAGHHGGLLRAHVRGGGRRRHADGDVGGGLHRAQVHRRGVPAVPGRAHAAVAPGAARRPAGRLPLVRRRRAQPQGRLPRRLLDQRAQPQGRAVLPGLRAAVHRARRPRTRRCTSCCWACCSTSTAVPVNIGWALAAAWMARRGAVRSAACTGSTAPPAFCSSPSASSSRSPTRPPFASAADPLRGDPCP